MIIVMVHEYMPSDIFKEKNLCWEIHRNVFFTPNSMHSKMYFNICLILFVKRENNVFIHYFTFLY